MNEYVPYHRIHESGENLWIRTQKYSKKEQAKATDQKRPIDCSFFVIIFFRYIRIMIKQRPLLFSLKFRPCIDLEKNMIEMANAKNLKNATFLLILSSPFLLKNKGFL